MLSSDSSIVHAQALRNSTDMGYSGKVFVYTGILPVCGNEDGLAAVLGHEIAHVVAHHPAERMSNSLITMGAVLLISMLFDISGQIPSLLLNLMYSLPNSRTQEVSLTNIYLMDFELTHAQAEADEIGLCTYH